MKSHIFVQHADRDFDVRLSIKIFFQKTKLRSQLKIDGHDAGTISISRQRNFVRLHEIDPQTKKSCLYELEILQMREADPKPEADFHLSEDFSSHLITILDGPRLTITVRKMVDNISDMKRRDWAFASEYDPTLREANRHWRAIQSREIKSQRFSKLRMFQIMADAEIGLYQECPVRARCRQNETETSAVLRAMEAFSGKTLPRVRMGPSERVKKIHPAQLAQAWLRGRSILCTTDFHIRKTNLVRAIDCTPIGEFNLFPWGSDRMAEQEMLSLVVSSQGSTTTSHSDDPDSTNHCFTGRKLWLAWETFEGEAVGLQDVERHTVENEAKFNLVSWLRLPSARWCIVEPGMTLFLPGHLTHKVITLEKYIGVGSFNIGIPNVVRSLARWIEFGPLWGLADTYGYYNGLISEIGALAKRKILRLRDAPQEVQQSWGANLFRRSIHSWVRRTPRVRMHRIVRSPEFNEMRPFVEPFLRSQAQRELRSSYFMGSTRES